MSFFIAIFKSTFYKALINVLYFPIWWYSFGLKKRITEFGQGTINLFRNLALKLMITHLFKPMFGERSKSGRIISFFMRLILLVWRLFLFVLGTVSRFALLVIWIILPIIAMWQIIVLLK